MAETDISLSSTRMCWINEAKWSWADSFLNLRHYYRLNQCRPDQLSGNSRMFTVLVSFVLHTYLLDVAESLRS